LAWSVALPVAVRPPGSRGFLCSRQVAEDALSRVEVRAPHAGIILGVKVKSPGAVIQPGATLAEVVPASTLLSLTAKVSPLDVQNVEVWQRAQVRFPAFSTRSTAPLYGHVASISADNLHAI